MLSNQTGIRCIDCGSRNQRTHLGDDSPNGQPYRIRFSHWLADATDWLADATHVWGWARNETGDLVAAGRVASVIHGRVGYRFWALPLLFAGLFNQR